MNRTETVEPSETTLEVPAMNTFVSRSRQDLADTRPLTLSETLTLCTPIPSCALFVGLAGDGLPVLLNLRSGSPGPVLVAADAGAGKTRLLQIVARAVDRIHDPDRVRYAVITESPSEWAGFDQSGNCEGILSFHHALTTGYVASLAHAAQRGSLSTPCLVLLLDDFQALVSDGDLGDSARWILRLGASHGIWSFVTLSTTRPRVPDALLDPFHVRLLGSMRDRHAAAELSTSSSDLFSRLRAGSEFAMSERQTWLPFRLPVLD